MENAKGEEKIYSVDLNETEMYSICKLRSKYSKHGVRTFRLWIIALLISFSIGLGFHAQLEVVLGAMLAPIILWIIYFWITVVRHNRDAREILETLKYKVR